MPDDDVVRTRYASLLVVAASGCGPRLVHGRRDAATLGAFPGMGGIRFAADASATPVPEGVGTVVLAYAVTYDELFFLRDGDGYRARFEVTAILYDETATR